MVKGMARQAVQGKLQGHLSGRVARDGAGPIDGRWSPGTVCAIVLTLLLAATQLFIWAKAIEARGGAEYYVRGIDLMPTIAGGVAIRDGAGASLYDFAVQLAAQRQVRAPYLSLGNDQLLPYIHPPFEALVIAPFIDLSYPLLYAILTGLAVCAVGGSYWLLAHDLPLRGAGYWVLLAAASSYHPLYQALWLGQTSPFVLLGICGIYATLAHRKEYWAAMPLLLIALKPQAFLVFALLLLLLGHWRTLAAAAGVLAASSVAAMPFLGLLWPLRYATFLATIAGWDVPHAVYPASMPTLRGLTVNLLGGIAPSLATVVATLLSALALGTLVWCWWRTRTLLPPQPSVDRAPVQQRDWLWALASIVAVLVPAHMGPHDHTLLIFPAWIVTSYAVSGQWGRAYARLWYALLWGTYGIMLLLPFTTDSPAIVVVPSVTLLLIGAAALAWRIGNLSTTPAPDNHTPLAARATT